MSDFGFEISDFNPAMSHNEVFQIDEQPSWGLNWHLPWWLLAAVAIAVAEWTAHPVLGVVIFCVKFGFNDWRTAAWLCRMDPNGTRSRTIWWFLLGSGFLKIFMVSVFVYPLLALLWGILINPPDGIEFVVSVLVGMLGILFSLVVTHTGAVLAARRGVKVWLNRQLHEHRDRNIWPPNLSPPNQLKSIIDGSSMPAIGGFVVGVAFAIVGIMNGALPAAATGALIFVVSAVILLSHAILLKRIVARTPSECWGEPRRPAVVTDNVLLSEEILEDDDSND